MDKEKPEKNSDQKNEPMLAVSIVGKNSEIWEKREPRFVERITNSVKKIFGADIPAYATVDEDLKEAAEDLASSAKAAIKTPQLKNLDRQATINLKLAEIKLKEANARKTNLEADLLEQELKMREDVHNSQKYVDLLIQRGELIPVEKEGELIFIYKKK